jgi:hypothetical protein
VSGFYFTPKDDAGHIATPSHGTWTRERDGQPADSRVESDYPITAECRICQGRIRLNRLMQMEWRHVPAEVAATGGGKEQGDGTASQQGE